MESDRQFTTLPKHLRFRVGLLLGGTVILAVALVYYALHARGTFEQTQHITLVTEDAEGVTAGMELTFAGFPIGRVENLSLASDGRARILVQLARKDAKWLRTTSIFTLEKSLFGTAKMRAHSGNLRDPELPENSERPILRGDATEEVPRMVATLRSALENIESITGEEGNLQVTLENLRATSERLSGKQGALAAAMGEEDAKKVVAAVERANQLLTSLDRVSQRLESVVGKTDERVFGKGGMVEVTQAVVTEAGQILGNVRETLRKADAVMSDAQQVGTNARAATQDLAALRAEVDANLRKMDILIDEMNRKWPFKRDTEIKLP